MASCQINKLPTIVFQYGSDVSFTATRKNSSDVPVPLTGYSVEAHFEYNDRILTEATATASISDAPNGEATIEVSHQSVTALSVKSGSILFVTWTAPTGKIKVNRFKVSVE